MKVKIWTGGCALVGLFMISNLYADPLLTSQQENIVKAMVDLMAGETISVPEKDKVKSRIIDAANKGQAQELSMQDLKDIDGPWILFSAIMYSYMNKTLCVNYDDKCRANIAADEGIEHPDMTREEERIAEKLSERKLKEIGLAIPKFTN